MNSPESFHAPEPEEEEPEGDGRALKLWSEDYDGIKVGLAIQLAGEKYPTPFHIEEIWSNPAGGPDLVKLRRKKLMLDYDYTKEAGWFRSQGYEVDDSSDPVYWFITVNADKIAERKK